MARPAIFVTLIAATLIGPCLCCCVLARVFARPATVARVGQPCPEPAEKPACPHCRPASHGPTAQTPVPADPTEPTQPCPCCDGKVMVTATVPPTLSHFAVDVPFVALLPFASDVPTASGSRELPVEYPPGWGTQAFLLDSCHRLRC